MKGSAATRALRWVAVLATAAALVAVLGPGFEEPWVAPPPPAPARIADAGAADASARKDFLALAEAAMRIRDGAERRATLARILVEWLAVDPAAVGKYIMLLEVRNDDAKLDDLADALQLALAELQPDVVSSAVVRDALRRVVQHVARTDPDAALELAQAWLDDERREAVWADVARTLAARDPGEALALAARMTSPLRRMQAFAVVGGVWARSDAGAALAWASSLAAPTERAMALDAALSALAQGDATAAAEHLASAERTMADDYEQRYFRELEAMNLTEADLANDPEKFAELLEAGEIPPPTSSDVELMGDAARVVALELARDRPEAAIAWAESLENDFLRLNAVKGAVAGWSQVDPAAAAGFAAAYYGGYAEIVTAAYDAWATTAPASAAASARLLDDPHVRAVATEAVAQAWAVAHPLQAAAWLDALPSADRSDAVVLAVVTGLSTSHPLEAWARAQWIADPALQYRGLKAAFSALVVREPAAARDLLASTVLAATTVERLQDLLEAAQG